MWSSAEVPYESKLITGSSSPWTLCYNSVLRVIKQANSADAKEEGPPGKKRKVEKAQNQSKLPNVIKLVVSPDQKYAVAVTSDDKCIRVFEVLETGKLMGISQR